MVCLMFCVYALINCNGSTVACNRWVVVWVKSITAPETWNYRLSRNGFRLRGFLAVHPFQSVALYYNCKLYFWIICFLKLLRDEVGCLLVLITTVIFFITKKLFYTKNWKKKRLETLLFVYTFCFLLLAVWNCPSCQKRFPDTEVSIKKLG